MALLDMATDVPLNALAPPPRTEATVLDVAFPMPGEWTDRQGRNRALGAGLSFVPWGVQTITVTKLECSEDEAETVPHGFETAVTQLPFRLTNGVTCTSLSTTTGDELRDAAMTQLRQVESAAFAQQLIDATTTPAAGLASTATVIVSNAAVTVTRAFARIEDFLATRLFNAVGFIHVSPGVFALAVAADVVMLRDGMWQTATGHLVIADAGYATAAAPTGQAQQQAESKWIYASGPVWYSKSRTDDVEGANTAGAAFNFAHNDHEAFTESYGVLAFDPETVGAVRVDMTA
jgi:hypothetical protein